MGTTIFFSPSAHLKAVPVTQATPFPITFGAGSSSQFGEGLVAERTPIIELNSSYGPTLYRNVLSTTNTGTATKSATGEILLSSGTTASSTVTISSGERGRYIPGYGAEVGVGIRVPTPPTGDQEIMWGLMSPDLQTGFYFGYDSEGLYTAILRQGVVTEKTRQADFNLDPADGTGQTDFVLDPSDGNIFQINFTWYGYGQVVFGVLAVVGDFQRFVPLHQFRPTNATSIETPNLPVTVMATNGTTTTDVEAYIGGRQYSIVGKYIPSYRFSGQEVVGASAASGVATPLITFRNKSGFEDRSLQVEHIRGIISSNPVVMEIYVNATLTGASFGNWTNATASETSVEVDTDATALSGGILVWSDYFQAGQGSNVIGTSAPQNFNVPENQPITLAARGVGGAATVDAFLGMREEW